MAEAVQDTRSGTRARLLRELPVDLVLLAVGAYALVTSLGWPSRAAVFPKYISIVLLLLVAARVIGVVVRALRLRTADTGGDAGGDAGDDAGPAAVNDIAMDLRGHRKDLLVFSGVFLAFGACFVTLGFTVGSAVAAIAYVRFVARDSWLVAVLTGLGLAAMIWGLGAVFGLQLRLGIFQ